MKLRVKAMPCCGIAAIGLLHSDDVSGRAAVTVPMPLMCGGSRHYISQDFIPAGLCVNYWHCNVVAAIDNDKCHKKLNLGTAGTV